MNRKHFLILPAILICYLNFTSCKKSEETVVDSKEKFDEKKRSESNINNGLLLKLVNDVRTKGCDCKELDGSKTKMPPVGPLTWSNELVKIAKGHSNDMETKNYFDHVNKEGKRSSDRMTEAGYIWSACAENIAMGQKTEIEVFKAWMDSNHGHCQNIMNDKVKEMGVARSQGNGYYWTQLFGAKE